MSYKQVKTPKFYINNILYATNNDKDIYNRFLSPDENAHNNKRKHYSLFDGNPFNPVRVKANENTSYEPTIDASIETTKIKYNPAIGSLPNDFIAILGHNFASTSHGLSINYTSGNEQGGTEGLGLTEILNANIGPINNDGSTSGNFITSTLDGFSLCEITEGPAQVYGGDIVDFIITKNLDNVQSVYLQIGSIIIGNIYTMPLAVDMEVSISTDYDYIKKVESLNGGSYSNSFYNTHNSLGALEWNQIANPLRYTGAEFPGYGSIDYNTQVGDIPGWTDFNNYIYPYLQRKGKYAWDLNFSIIPDRDLWGPNLSNSKQLNNTNGMLSSDLQMHFPGPVFTNIQTLVTSNSFFAQVINKCGLCTPFIFQPDSDRNDPDSFYLATFDMDSLQVESYALGHYRVSLRIVEI